MTNARGATCAKVWMLCALASLGGCHRDAAPAGPVPTLKTAPTAVAAPGPSAAEQTNGMVEAATVVKSQLGVELKFDIPERPVVGQPLEVKVAVTPHIAASPVAIDVTGAQGLDIAPVAKQFQIAAVEAGSVYRETIKLTPTAEGVSFLGLTVSLKHDEITESRVFSIPLIVFSAADQPR